MDENNMNQEPVNQEPVYQQPINQQPVYQQPPYGQPELETPNSIGDWFLTILLTYIPCIGLIMLFIWAFGGGTQKSKANWAKAQLIWILVGMVLSFIFYMLMGAAIKSIFEAMGSMSQSY